MQICWSWEKKKKAAVLNIHTFMFKFYFAEAQFPCWKDLVCKMQAEQEFRKLFALWSRQIHQKKKYCLPTKGILLDKR